MRRRGGVVARRARARIEHAQGKALRAVAKVVAPGQQVAGAEQVEMLIGFCDDVVAIVGEWRGEGLAAAGLG